MMNKWSNLRLTHERFIFSYFNIFSDFLSLFLNFYAMPPLESCLINNKGQT